MIPKPPSATTPEGLTIDPLGAGLVLVCMLLVVVSTEHSNTTNLIITIVHVLVVLLIMIVGEQGWCCLKRRSGSLTTATAAALNPAHSVTPATACSPIHPCPLSPPPPRPGFVKANPKNLHPFVPPEHGVRGIFAGASFVFFRCAADRRLQPPA